MTIANWPLSEQPREKIFSRGAKNLSDAELIAIVLRTGTTGKTALDIGRDLLREFGSLKKLWNADPKKILAKQGLGRAKYAVFMAALELGRRYFEEEVSPGTILNNSQLTQRFLAARLQHYTQEVFACIFLDCRNSVICFEELFFGTLTEAPIYPREVDKKSLKYNAARLILAHNHPSGDPTPSQEDQKMTQLLKKALALVEIQIVDHVVVGNKKTLSFAEHGLL